MNKSSEWQQKEKKSDAGNRQNCVTRSLIFIFHYTAVDSVQLTWTNARCLSLCRYLSGSFQVNCAALRLIFPLPLPTYMYIARTSSTTALWGFQISPCHIARALCASCRSVDRRGGNEIISWDLSHISSLCVYFFHEGIESKIDET